MKLLEKIEESKQHERNYVYVFILITICFALWGFANSVTLPMVNAFSRISLVGTHHIQFRLLLHGHPCRTIHPALLIQKGYYLWLNTLCLRLLFLPAS